MTNRPGQDAARRRGGRRSRGRPTHPTKLKPLEAPGPYVPAAPRSLADAASLLGIRPVELAQAVREGKVATVRGRGRQLLVAHEEMERVRREGVGVG